MAICEGCGENFDMDEIWGGEICDACLEDEDDEEFEDED